MMPKLTDKEFTTECAPVLSIKKILDNYEMLFSGIPRGYVKITAWTVWFSFTVSEMTLSRNDTKLNEMKSGGSDV